MLPDHALRVPLVPRTTANCLDLAVRYYGRHLPQMVCLWLIAAVPAGAVVYFLSAEVELDVRMAVAVVWFFSLLLGLLVVSDVVGFLLGETPPADVHGHGRPLSGVASRLAAVGLPILLLLVIVRFDRDLGFRVPRDVRVLISGVVLGAVMVLVPSVLLLNQRQRLRASTWAALPAGLLMRCVIGVGPALVLFGHGALILLGLMLTVLPGWWLAARFGFLAERAALRRVDRRLHEPYVDAVLRKELGDLCVRGAAVAAFCLLAFVVLLLTLDIAAGLLLGRPTLLERVADVHQAWRYLTVDPLVLTATTATALLVYPVGRLAWFFCYLDIRVRRDGWDMELALAQEAARLRQSA